MHFLPFAECRLANKAILINNLSELDLLDCGPPGRGCPTQVPRGRQEDIAGKRGA